jgi:chromosomal replication initiation ATPase DnaA
MSQLPLDLAFPPRYGPDDFLVSSSNSRAFDALSGWRNWPNRTVILVGPEGSGKTHLAAIWAERAAARHIDGADLALWDPAATAAGPLVVDDADQLGQEEATLFHVLNVARESDTFLLLTASKLPDLWGLRTPDLLSRLRLADLFTLDAPDDDLLRAVLVKQLLDRQLLVEQLVIDYLVLRIDRSFAAVRQVVDALDRASLAAHRRITRPIAAAVLEGLLESH